MKKKKNPHRPPGL